MRDIGDIEEWLYLFMTLDDMAKYAEESKRMTDNPNLEEPSGKPFEWPKIPPPEFVN